ncbi:MAG: hypothetical protein GY847_33080 [Proteobacteria bacterium]|nr:hypothetical protein [Pseudomonadota bacterium]
MEDLERRRSYRVKLGNAWAECCSAGSAGFFEVGNISGGGALLRGHSLFPEKTDVRVLLHIPGFKNMTLDSVVSRCDLRMPSSPQVAIKFGFLSDDEKDVIADTVASSVIQELSPGVLICNSRRWEAKALAKTLYSIGYNPIRAITPLCAIRQLAHENQHIKAVILGMNLGKTSALETASFIAEYRPDIKLILVAKPNWRTLKAATSVMHDVVRKPWTAERLKKALATPREAA